MQINQKFSNFITFVAGLCSIGSLWMFEDKTLPTFWMVAHSLIALIKALKNDDSTAG